MAPEGVAAVERGTLKPGMFKPATPTPKRLGGAVALGCIKGGGTNIGGVRSGGIPILKEVVTGTEVLEPKVIAGCPPLDDCPSNNAI